MKYLEFIKENNNYPSYLIPIFKDENFLIIRMNKDEYIDYTNNKYPILQLQYNAIPDTQHLADDAIIYFILKKNLNWEEKCLYNGERYRYLFFVNFNGKLWIPPYYQEKRNNNNPNAFAYEYGYKLFDNNLFGLPKSILSHLKSYYEIYPKTKNHLANIKLFSELEELFDENNIKFKYDEHDLKDIDFSKFFIQIKQILKNNLV